MSDIWGKNIQLAIFGESHGAAIGGVISSLPAGVAIDFEKIDKDLKRRNHRASYSTARAETDEYEILSGIYEGKTTGSALSYVIRNKDTRSGDYKNLNVTPRPGHADYPASVKYGGFNDYRGGGHFSGRITAALVFAGSIAKQILASDGIEICAQILSIGSVKGKSFIDENLQDDKIKDLQSRLFAVTDSDLESAMMAEIEKYKSSGNSIGGIVECAVTGMEAGYGDPFFDSVESRLSSMLFSIPAVKGVEFGRGFDITGMSGFEANDFYEYTDGAVTTKTNNNGGLLGGITNGSPIVFKTAIKPTPSVSLEQETVDLDRGCNTTVEVKGRHDACIVPRAVAVVEAAAALVILDILRGGK
ncbi:MAG: chorismate synthase [Ruminococcaceae bacterium]|nr:chorismate synthase [Oscillospiraceae bacterium]